MAAFITPDTVAAAAGGGGAGPPSAAATAPRVRRIVKLGGAAITAKQALETPRHDVLQAAVQGLAASRTGLCDTVVVHGAGSFGHFQASEYGVAHGALTDPQVLKGFTLTRASVLKLNSLVVGALIEAGLPACGLSPFGLYTTSNRQVSVSGSAAVARALAAGLLPVVHGDAVLDEALGCTILGGDGLLADLARHLRPEFVVFLTNVAGVYDRPPEEAGAQLLTHIEVLQDGAWRAHGVATIKMTSSEHDTTGGIATKVAEAAAVARMHGGTPVLIAEAGTESGSLACRLGPGVLQLPSGAWRGTVVMLAAT